MKEKELRFGNLIYDYKNKQVTEWDSGKVYWIAECTIDFEYFKPIPIDEDWLINMGFTPTTCSDKPKWSDNYHDLTYYDLNLGKEKFYDLSLLSSYVENEDIYVELFPYENPKVKYVHELQNLYFALTKEELTIKE